MSAQRSRMQRGREMPPGKQYFFVTLHARQKQSTFQQYPEFKNRIEELWAEVMRLYQRIDAAAYNVNSVSLHALLEITASRPGDEKVPELLGKAIGSYRTLAQSEWERYWKKQEQEPPAELWEPRFEVREIHEQDELESLREFIVQKMLGGEELSDLGLEEDDEEWEE